MATRGPLQVERLDATFGARVTGIDLRELDDTAFQQLHDLWLDAALLIFPDQHLTDDEQVRFAGRFGRLDFKIAALSNVLSDGSVRPDDKDDEVIAILRGNMGWHADSTYMPVQAKGAVFTARVVPPSGGQTGWADMRAAYQALDAETRTRIHGLSAFHSLYYSQGELGHKPKDDADKGPDDYSGYGFHNQPPPLRPLVKIHPETGRPSLLIGRHAFGIPGLSQTESRRLLQELMEFACQPPRTHHHHWTPGDAVLWDNRCLLHQATPWDMAEPRVMMHSRIAGNRPSERARPAPHLMPQSP
ncbi:TauD/TfdA family dioxygenase [Myxococcota bacterium]|nr:TauD/TfdA family dioxygenase [Myxococcota bacterium]